MADWYVYSGATGTAAGTSWTNATTTLQAAITLGAAGDTYYVAHDHAETAAAATTITFKGTAAAIDRVICVDRAGSVPPVAADLRPPTLSGTTWTPTATITTTGANALTIAAGFYYYIEGITFSAGTGATTANMIFGVEAACYLKNCGVRKLGTTGSATAIYFNTTTASRANSMIWDNVFVQFGSTSDTFIPRGGVEFIWKNTEAAIQGATIPTTIFNTATSNTTNSITVDGVDFSAMGSGKNLTGANASSQRYKFINCKLSTTASVATSSGTTPRGARTEAVISDSTSTGYRQEVYDYSATLTTETVIVRTGGASDGVQAISHKIVSTANAKALAPFESFPLAIWNTATGSSKTVTVEIVNDGTTLTNADIWLEVSYLSSSSTPLSKMATSGLATTLTTATNIPTSSVTWTTTGLASPVKQYLAVSFTPQMVGYVRAVVKVAKASQTVYVDPKITIT